MVFSRNCSPEAMLRTGLTSRYAMARQPYPAAKIRRILVDMATAAPPRGDTMFTPYPAAPNADASAPASGTPAWPLWQRVLFRFFFVYFGLQIEPWDWFRAIPGVSFLLQPYDAAMDWAVRTGNAHVFHIRETLVPMNGSGDTSYAYARLCLLL